jgi:UDP-sugar transporter A1/2/3
MLTRPPAQPELYFSVGSVYIRKKWASLVLLVLQTTVLVLLMRYSRVNAGDTPYLVSCAVVASEALKVVTSLVLLRSRQASWADVTLQLQEEFVHRDTLKLAVPGLLYLIQNNLLFIALSNLEAAVYQVTYQLKLMTTAVFSVAMLGKRLSSEQVLALFMLTGGVALVQLSESRNNSPSRQLARQDQDPLLGLGCVLLACISSGFAGVYLERVMKHGRPVSIWMRNVQLGVFGFLFGMVTVVGTDLHRVWALGFFQGFNAVVWNVVLIQAAGGLLVAAVIVYADNILKGFATSVSIVLSSIISVFLFSFELSAGFVLGAAMVVVAVVLYGRKDSPAVVAKPKATQI